MGKCSIHITYQFTLSQICDWIQIMHFKINHQIADLAELIKSAI